MSDFIFIFIDCHSFGRRLLISCFIWSKAVIWKKRITPKLKHMKIVDLLNVDYMYSRTVQPGIWWPYPVAEFSRLWSVLAGTERIPLPYTITLFLLPLSYHFRSFPDGTGTYAFILVAKKTQNPTLRMVRLGFLSWPVFSEFINYIVL